MEENELLPHLFRTEYRKIVSVLCSLFGIEHIETAEDIVSDTFLTAAELWGMKGLPANPAAWLYTVAKNKTRDHLRRDKLFAQKIAVDIKNDAPLSEDISIDLSDRNIEDSQLAMMFAVCHPSVSTEAQIALALNLLCGFGAEEIADAFLTHKETVYKRLKRAKEKLRAENVKIAQPTQPEVSSRLDTVLTTLYLLFNEGYYSASRNTLLRKDLCAEAMRLTLLLLQNKHTGNPAVSALLALMCFHASRFEARTDRDGEIILYEDQDITLWDHELIKKGEYYLNLASQGSRLSRYHLEAAIAYWHTHKDDTPEKWENILQLYNQLLQMEYSPIAALNRTYALSRANGKEEALVAAAQLDLKDHHLYHLLLGHLYEEIDNEKALQHFHTALRLTRSDPEKTAIGKNIIRLSGAREV
ncbi:RNA polymerase sigma factor [Compostibacter hankyongensis]|uniref:Sigma-70 family RNA polymerase sigma factor n=1 Tax=Compostibacter hankyongensis TaxID=1007089 RepID=A0ABP8FLK3_9BACT